MNFIKINWKLNDGETASTLVPEDKSQLVLEKLGLVTECWAENMP